MPRDSLKDAGIGHMTDIKDAGIGHMTDIKDAGIGSLTSGEGRKWRWV